MIFRNIAVYYDCPKNLIKYYSYMSSWPEEILIVRPRGLNSKSRMSLWCKETSNMVVCVFTTVAGCSRGLRGVCRVLVVLGIVAWWSRFRCGVVCVVLASSVAHRRGLAASGRPS